MDDITIELGRCRTFLSTLGTMFENRLKESHLTYLTSYETFNMSFKGAVLAVFTKIDVSKHQKSFSFKVQSFWLLFAC